jgi:serine protease Do
VEYIVPNSPAELSGLQTGDLLREINHHPVDSVYGIQERVATLDNPLVVNVTVERGSEEVTKKISLTKRPTYPAVYIYGRDAEENIITPLFGIVLAKEKEARRNTYIVSRTLQGSSAAKAGIVTGDEIKLRDLEYEMAGEYFYLVIDLKSKRFGYLSKSVVLYQYVSVNSFV